ncbi:MAG: hypothetical protein ACRDBO_15650 [Lachnospiraceae bacterium]
MIKKCIRIISIKRKKIVQEKRWQDNYFELSEHVLPLNFEWSISVSAANYTQHYIKYKDKDFVFHFFIDKNHCRKLNIYALISNLNYSSDFTLETLKQGFNWIESVYSDI